MRVIAGKHRGLRLASPPGEQTRPITDRVKESLFSLLSHRFGTPGWLSDLHVLDLFAGAGSLGIEALSRGAASCLFVERDRRTLPTLRENIARLREPAARICAENVWAMRFPRAPGAAPFDLIFVDPPYRDAANAVRVADLLERLAGRLSQRGVIAFRHEAGTSFDEDLLERLEIETQRRWGTMIVLLLRLRRDAPPAETAQEPAAAT